MDRKRDDLLARSVAHELRQPLALIAGSAELLATHRLPEADQAALIAAIRVAAARMAGSLARLDRPETLRWRQLGPAELLDLRPTAAARLGTPTAHSVSRTSPRAEQARRGRAGVVAATGAAIAPEGRAP